MRRLINQRPGRGGGSDVEHVAVHSRGLRRTFTIRTPDCWKIPAISCCRRRRPSPRRCNGMPSRRMSAAGTACCGPIPERASSGLLAALSISAVAGLVDRTRHRRFALSACGHRAVRRGFVADTPPLAVLPILFIVVGLGEAAKITLIIVGVAPIIVRDLAMRTAELPNEQSSRRKLSVLRHGRW